MPEGKIPICVGTGLIALDMVMNDDREEAPRLWAGGSCGNVLTVLAYFGWHSYPVARLGDDKAAKIIAADMREYKVKMRCVLRDVSVQTPIILQRIFSSSDGSPTHRFHWVCPNCGNWLPRYTPIPLREVLTLRDNLPKMTCFYFDRVSAAALHLARRAREQGALVIFEPPSIKEDEQFRKAVSVCDILKYSNEHTKHCSTFPYESPVHLVIETLGAEGLRYRLRRNGTPDNWRLLPSFRVARLKDAAGAGDWCTAGMIDTLAKQGQTSLDEMTEEGVVSALRYGQALSALNCAFEGARGAMYGLDKKHLAERIQEILDRKEARSSTLDALSTKTKRTAKCVCPACQTSVRKVKKAVDGG
jgi:sugar/nucleoside kinase (ribokinase family)